MKHGIISNKIIKRSLALLLTLALIFQLAAPITQVSAKHIEDAQSTADAKPAKPGAYDVPTDLNGGKYRIDYYDYKWIEPEYKYGDWEIKYEWVPKWEKKEWVTVNQGYWDMVEVGSYQWVETKEKKWVPDQYQWIDTSGYKLVETKEKVWVPAQYQWIDTSHWETVKEPHNKWVDTSYYRQVKKSYKERVSSGYWRYSSGRKYWVDTSYYKTVYYYDYEKISQGYWTTEYRTTKKWVKSGYNKLVEPGHYEYVTKREYKYVKSGYNKLIEPGHYEYVTKKEYKYVTTERKVWVDTSYRKEVVVDSGGGYLKETKYFNPDKKTLLNKGYWKPYLVKSVIKTTDSPGKTSDTEKETETESTYNSALTGNKQINELKKEWAEATTQEERDRIAADSNKIRENMRAEGIKEDQIMQSTDPFNQGMYDAYMKEKARIDKKLEDLDERDQINGDTEDNGVDYTIAGSEVYKDQIETLKKEHPNWQFEFYEAEVTWKNLIDNQDKGETNLIDIPNKYKELDPNDEDGWSPPLRQVIEYYADPRNFLDEKYVFQFQFVGYRNGLESIDGVESIMNDTVHLKFAETIMQAAKESGASTYFLASKIKGEASPKGNPLTFGTVPGYEGYFNYYNIGASGINDEIVLKNGAKRAQREGWDTPEKAIIGGAKIIAQQYIAIGQDTLYTSKFDIIGPDYYNHQYMQNIAVAKLEAPNYYYAYKNANALESEFIFKIPVYSDLPNNRIKLP